MSEQQPFDSVEMMRKIRRQLEAELGHLSLEERIRVLRERLRDEPLWQRLKTRPAESPNAAATHGTKTSP